MPVQQMNLSNTVAEPPPPTRRKRSGERVQLLDVPPGYLFRHEGRLYRKLRYDTVCRPGSRDGPPMRHVLRLVGDTGVEADRLPEMAEVELAGE